MKLCKNCKHFNNTKLLSECKRPLGLSPVTGLPKFRKTSAETERGLEHTGCGSSGKYFEPTVVEEDYDIVDPPVDFHYEAYKKKHDCKRSGCTVCVAFEH